MEKMKEYHTDPPCEDEDECETDCSDDYDEYNEYNGEED
jgi:hypothetical protein